MGGKVEATYIVQVTIRETELEGSELMIEPPANPPTNGAIEDIMIEGLRDLGYASDQVHAASTRTDK